MHVVRCDAQQKLGYTQSLLSHDKQKTRRFNYYFVVISGSLLKVEQQARGSDFSK